MTKSEIFTSAHAQAKRDANNSSKKYIVLFAIALKSAFKTAAMWKNQDAEMAAVYASRKEKNTTAAMELKATKGFNGKIYGTENNYSYYVNGAKKMATNEFVAAFNALDTTTTTTTTTSNSDSSSKRTTYKHASAFLNLDGEDWGYGDGDDN